MALSQTEKQKLRVLRGYIKMERASFGFDTERVTCNGFGGSTITTTKDAFIKDGVRLYLDTWAIPIIDDLLGEDADAMPAERSNGDG